ncbi:class I SAM-dependent methyltransferase [Streptomyces siamensis]|uniref:Methyltransferase type 11 domain-containing protein n=1 Tax=Streptomyces siamensis TaxID=1274986 RepID=A0ABP9JJV8_9ACTN
MSVVGTTTGATTETDDTSPVPVAHWEELFAEGRGFRRADARELTLLAGHVRPVSRQRALDVGCGLGGYAAGLAGLGYRTVAVDWAQSSVAAVRDRYSGLEPGLTAHCVDFEDDEAVQRTLAPGSFDLITMRLVLAFIRIPLWIPGLQAGEETDSCGAGQGKPSRRQGDSAFEAADQHPPLTTELIDCVAWRSR